MHVITARNVGMAYVAGMNHIAAYGIPADSRNGKVLAAATPVTTVYTNPEECVLFDARRDANPFLHLAEAIWMLCGRCDGKFLTRFAAQYNEYMEPDGRVYGAYGHRWRHALGFDQLDAVVEKLKKNPDDRQAVIQMWDARWEQSPSEDEFGCNDLNGNWKDRPCNTHVYLRVRRIGSWGKVLDITVCCRSNDIIWGAYGANAVHFSILQQYLAARIGVGVGRYYQISNNYHAYSEVFNQKWDRGAYLRCPYVDKEVHFLPLVDDPETFDAEAAYVLQLCEFPEKIHQKRDIKNKFLNKTVLHMLDIHHMFKEVGPEEALKFVHSIEATDWRKACKEWLERRKAARDAKAS